MAQSLNILPRTVASFYGSTVPRPYVVCDALGEVKQDRVAKPRVNAALVGAYRSAHVPRLGRRARCTRPARAAAPACRYCARAWRGLSPDKSPCAEWARSQSWSRGGLLADAVLRSAGRTTDASGRRKLRAEGDEEDEEVRACALSREALALARSRSAATLRLASMAGRRHRNWRCTPRQAPRWCVPLLLPRALSRLFC